MPHIIEETNQDLEQGLRYGPSRRQTRKYPRKHTSEAAKPYTFKVIFPAGYPEELGFSVATGADALELVK